MTKITSEEKKLYKSKEYILEHYTGPILNRNKAIKEKCNDCSCWQREEVILCPATSCTLWPYRFGGNPFSKGRVLSQEQREAIADRFSKKKED